MRFQCCLLAVSDLTTRVEFDRQGGEAIRLPIMPARSVVELAELSGQRARRSWHRRLVRSSGFAQIISVAAHAAAFGILYSLVFREGSVPRRVIIPEARLAPPSAEPVTPRLARLDIPREAAPDAMPLSVPRLTELPIAIVDLAGPGELAVPYELTSMEVSSLSTPGLSSAPVDGPTSTFFGQAGNAYKVVYVVDLSESIAAYFPDIAAEMHRSIRSLVPTQEFGIIFARPGRVVQEFEPSRLIRATRQSKQRAGDFCKTMAEGNRVGPADPVTAIRKALATDPELIYFLSDGAYAEQQSALLQMLERQTRDRQVKITTLGFEPSLHGAGGLLSPEALLKRISEITGGHYRKVRFDG